MHLRTLSTILSDVLSHLPGAEYERAKCEGLAAQVQEQRAHIEDLARRLEYTTRQKDEAEEREAEVAKDAEARLNAVWHHIGEKKTLTDERDAAQKDSARLRTQSHNQADALLTTNSDLAAVKEERDAEKASHENTVRDRNARIAERNEARSERDEWKRNCESVQIDRATVKAQYEAEKVAHGDTQRHLTAAIAERDEWQLSHGTLAREKERLKVELHTLRARVVELQAGEPVAWVINYADGDKYPTRDREYVDVTLRGLPDATVTPLYAAPQPAAPAYGVEGERFGCLVVNSPSMPFLRLLRGQTTRIGTRAEAQAAADNDDSASVVRVIPADAPVVDVAKIREVIADLGASYPRLFASESAHLLRAAIGEKA